MSRIQSTVCDMCGRPLLDGRKVLAPHVRGLEIDACLSHLVNALPALVLFQVDDLSLITPESPDGQQLLIESKLALEEFNKYLEAVRTSPEVSSR